MAEGLLDGAADNVHADASRHKAPFDSGGCLQRMLESFYIGAGEGRPQAFSAPVTLKFQIFRRRLSHVNHLNHANTTLKDSLDSEGEGRDSHSPALPLDLLKISR
jgi:hypothetical protein